jgi:hypothetical protein
VLDETAFEEMQWAPPHAASPMTRIVRHTKNLDGHDPTLPYRYGSIHSIGGVLPTPGPRGGRLVLSQALIRSIKAGSAAGACPADESRRRRCNELARTASEPRTVQVCMGGEALASL